METTVKPQTVSITGVRFVDSKGRVVKSEVVKSLPLDAKAALTVLVRKSLGLA